MGVDNNVQFEPGVLVVHTRTGVIEVRLTGDPSLDALLARVAARGGCVLKKSAHVAVAQ